MRSLKNPFKKRKLIFYNLKSSNVSKCKFHKHMNYKYTEYLDRDITSDNKLFSPWLTWNLWQNDLKTISKNTRIATL